MQTVPASTTLRALLPPASLSGCGRPGARARGLLLAMLMPVGSTAGATPPIEAPSLGFDFRRAGNTGVGVINGPFLSGLSIEHHVTDHDAIQVSFGAAWGTYRYWPAHGIGLSVDYLHHPATVYDGPDVRLGWDIGIGVQGRVRPVPEDVRYAVGVHVVAGFDIMLVNAPIDLAFEYRPGIVGTPGPGGLTFAFGDVAVHLRWWMRPRRRPAPSEPTPEPPPPDSPETTDPPEAGELPISD
jgi:hypothetical protein